MLHPSSAVSSLFDRVASVLCLTQTALMQVRDSRVPLLKKAADRLLEKSKFSSLRQEMDSFRSQNPWVEDSALFFCLIKLQVSCNGPCCNTEQHCAPSSCMHPLPVMAPAQHICSCTQAVSDIQLACFLALWSSHRQAEMELQTALHMCVDPRKAVMMLD